MKEIEIINTLECFFRENENCANTYCETRSGLCKIEREFVFETAINAIREKAEREKGCSLCNGTELDKLAIADNETRIVLWGGNNKPNKEESVKYCPNCGRKLTEK